MLPVVASWTLLDAEMSEFVTAVQSGSPVAHLKTLGHDKWWDFIDGSNKVKVVLEHPFLMKDIYPEEISVQLVTCFQSQ